VSEESFYAIFRKYSVIRRQKFLNGEEGGGSKHNTNRRY